MRGGEWRRRSGRLQRASDRGSELGAARQRGAAQGKEVLRVALHTGREGRGRSLCEASDKVGGPGGWGAKNARNGGRGGASRAASSSTAAQRTAGWWQRCGRGRERICGRWADVHVLYCTPGRMLALPACSPGAVQGRLASRRAPKKDALAGFMLDIAGAAQPASQRRGDSRTSPADSAMPKAPPCCA